MSMTQPNLRLTPTTHPVAVTYRSCKGLDIYDVFRVGVAANVTAFNTAREIAKRLGIEDTELVEQGIEALVLLKKPVEEIPDSDIDRAISYIRAGQDPCSEQLAFPDGHGGIVSKWPDDGEDSAE